MPELFAADRLGPPPRTIGPLLAAQMLLGRSRSQVGWLITGLGSIFFWAFACNADLSGSRFQPARTAEVQGEALDCRDTRFSEGGSEHRRGTPIYENRYRYVVNGQPYESASYSAGRCVPGGAVMVQYLAAEPATSRIAGMRRKPFGPWATVTALLPAAGLFLIIGGWASGRKALYLLREGLPAAGRLVEQAPTRVRVNNRQVYRMIFEYQAVTGACRLTVRSHLPEQFETPAARSILYDPGDPNTAIVAGSLPQSVSIDEARLPATSGSVAFFVLPALTILSNAWYVHHHWFTGA